MWDALGIDSVSVPMCLELAPSFLRGWTLANHSSTLCLSSFIYEIEIKVDPYQVQYLMSNT